jgi:hypothetical protein
MPRRTRRVTRLTQRRRRTAPPPRYEQFDFEDAFTARYGDRFEFYVVKKENVPHGPELRSVAQVREIPTVNLRTIRARLTETYVMYFVEGAHVRCILTFTPLNDEGRATVDEIACPTKVADIQPTSAILFYRLAALLTRLDVPHIDLLVAASGDTFWRLYELYERYGFRCVSYNDGKPDFADRLSALNRGAPYNTTLQTQRMSGVRDPWVYFGQCFGMVAFTADVLARTGGLLGL